MDKPAKKSSVTHSTFSKTVSNSLTSANNSKTSEPSKAIQPRWDQYIIALF